MNRKLLGVALVLGTVGPQYVHAQTASYVQINTNALGQNILGDAANEPTIAVDPTNPKRMAVGWRQFDTISSNFRQAGVAYTTNGGVTWTAGVLTSGQYRTDPVLRSDAAGNFYFSSLDVNNAVQVFKSTNGGVTWGAPVSSYGGDKQWIAIDTTNGPGQGNVYQVWNTGNTTVPGASFTRSTNGGSSFEFPVTGPSPSLKWGTATVAPDGTFYAVGATLNLSNGHLISKSTNAQFAAQSPTFATQSINLGGTTSSTLNPAANPGGLLGQPNIAIASNGNIYVLGSVKPPGSSGQCDVMFIRSTNGGANWSSPVKVNSNPAGENSYQWFGTMSVAPNGRIDAVWNDTSVNPNNNFSVLKYAYSLDDGLTWLGQIALTPQFNHTLGYPMQNKLGDYYDMTSDDFGANLTFAATFTGGQDVYYMRITAVHEPSLILFICAIGIVGLRRLSPTN